jgi:hypothetical protein
MIDYRELVAYLPRPKSVDDWSDTTEVLEQHVAALVATLGDGWTTEGPVDEADSLYTTSIRRLGDREHTIWFSFDHLDGAATMPRAVPDPMRFEVRVQEERRGDDVWVPPATPLRKAPRPSAFAVALALALLGGALTLAWASGRALSGWLVPSLAFVLAVVGFVVARAAAPGWIENRLHPGNGRRTSRPPSPELLALTEAIERYLRASFIDVTRLAADE